MSDFVEIGGEQFRTNKIAVWIPVSEQVLLDGMIDNPVGDFWRRYTEPWLFADGSRWPSFEPLPRMAAFGRWADERRRRVRDAWAVLTGREAITHEEW